MQKASNKYLVVGIYLFLAIFVLAVFGQVCFHEFVNYDDDLYVTANDHVKNGFSLESIKWAFTEQHVANWHPLTSLSHMLDCQLFGLKSWWHHLVNLLFHMANTLLLFAIFKKLSGKIWPSVLAALIFAVHPLRMESVAWVAERKDVLSGFFWLLTMYAYIGYAQKPCIKKYVPVFLFTAMGLMSKPMVVTLPAVLLLMDYWPLKRLQPNETNNTKVKKQKEEIKNYSAGFLIVEKIPLLLLVIGSSILTFIFQKKGGGINDAETWPFIYRLENVFVSYISYLSKTFYPAHLAVFYPHPGTSLQVWQVICAALVLIVITVLFFRLRKERPYLLIGWLWFVGTMVPAIGLVQAGQQGMADRYTYIPSIGLCLILVWLVSQLSKNNFGSKVTILISVCVVIALSASTIYQLRYWKNNETLFSHAVAVTENNHIMNNNYGNFLLNQGQYDKAIEHFSKAVQIKSSYELAHENLARAYNDWAVNLQKENKIDQAIEKWKESLSVNPNHSKANYNLGLVLSKQGKFDQAVNHFIKTLQAEPNWDRPYNDLALAYEKLGQHDLAIENYNKALAIDPNYPNANYNLGCCYYRGGNLPLAVKYWQKTLELKPDFTEILNNLALILAARENPDVFNPTMAINYAQRACQLPDNNQAKALSTLALTYSAADQKDLAVQTAQKAIELAESSNQNELAGTIRQLLISLKSPADANQTSPK